MKSRTIKVDYLARVEGEGGIHVKIRGTQVKEVKFTVFEPPRFFEAFLRGRPYSEAPDITARICGICPIAYQMSAVQAMERAFGAHIDGQLRSLRRLLYCGEWIESHVLHIFFLHAPDFLGYEDALRMAKDYGAVVQMALKLKKIGNEIVNLVGGREIHPINVRVGGFYRVPSKKELQSLIEPLEWARDAAIQAVKFCAQLPFPDFERDYEFVALRHDHEYPMNEGRLVSNKGLNIDIAEYEEYFLEEHVSYSTALHSIIKQRGAYFVGPLARFNLNYDKLTSTVKELAKNVGIAKGTNNPFKSIIVRALETLYACEEAIKICKTYEEPISPSIPIEPHMGIGYGCTEAPRGILYHRYRLDERGKIVDAKIVPPTAQNQKSMEQDLREFIPPRVKISQEKLQWQCEQVIRNYDPCISCSVHLVTLECTDE
ncbi:MAG: Ni/Fe hydrogenase subunit alpha [Bacteroidetes bacterium]|nr:Ni/Fe hydrogenase subunit alpha [Bacteroidota bacterium]